MDEALQRVDGAQLAQLGFPQFDKTSDRDPLGKGMAASPGAATGQIVFTSKAAEKAAEEGREVILVRKETNPDDLGG